MIPDNTITLQNGIKVVTQPTYTHRLFFDRNKVTGYTDGLTAMEQAVYKILQTERYRYVIYDWGYGIELEDLFGMPTTYVKAELPRRIREALLWDKRITGVDHFVVTVSRSARTVVSASFTVHTIFGALAMSKEVPV